MVISKENIDIVFPSRVTELTQSSTQILKQLTNYTKIVSMAKFKLIALNHWSIISKCRLWTHHLKAIIVEYFQLCLSHFTKSNAM